MPVITNVVVQQTNGNHDVVLTSLSGDYQQGPTAVGVIVMQPLNTQNGGPAKGPFGIGNIYTINATEGPNQVQIANVRYLGLTPAGNAQFTTD